VDTVGAVEERGSWVDLKNAEVDHGGEGGGVFRGVSLGQGRETLGGGGGGLREEFAWRGSEKITMVRTSLGAATENKSTLYSITGHTLPYTVNTYLATEKKLPKKFQHLTQPGRARVH